jgi:hypothetical protein
MRDEGKKVLARLLDEMMPLRAAPRLALVKKTYPDAGKGKYCVDVELLKAGSLEKTGTLLPEVPLNPVWAGSGGRGLYATPATGQVVVIEFLEWDTAFPYVAGVWGDKYEAAEHPDGTLTLTDGKSMFRIDTDGLFKFETAKMSMKALLEKFIDEIEAMQTFGPPPQHKVHPSTVKKLEALRLEIAKIFK